MKRLVLLPIAISLGIASSAQAAPVLRPLRLRPTSLLLFKPFSSRPRLSLPLLNFSFAEKRFRLELTIAEFVRLPARPLWVTLEDEQRQRHIQPHRLELELETEEEPPEELAKLGLIGHGHCVHATLHGQTFGIDIALRERHAMDESGRIESADGHAHTSHTRPEEELVLRGRVRF